MRFLIPCFLLAIVSCKSIEVTPAVIDGTWIGYHEDQNGATSYTWILREHNHTIYCDSNNVILRRIDKFGNIYYLEFEYYYLGGIKTQDSIYLCFSRFPVWDQYYKYQIHSFKGIQKGKNLVLFDCNKSANYAINFEQE